eukprot:jgi/Chrzof1/8384/Cz03g08170.t1
MSSPADNHLCTALLSAAAGIVVGSITTYIALRNLPCNDVPYEQPDGKQFLGASTPDLPESSTGAFSINSPVDAKKRKDPYDPSPRQGYLSWDDYFMAVAFLSAQRSKDPNKQVGACIVNPEQVIVGIGYNGFPRGVHDSKLPWAKKSRTGNILDTKYPYVVHAEANALLNKNAAHVAGARVYVTMFPCNECAKLLIQAGIKEVVYHEAKLESHHPSVLDSETRCSSGSSGDEGHASADAGYMASRSLLTLAGVKLRQHTLQRCIHLGKQQQSGNLDRGQ